MIDRSEASVRTSEMPPGGDIEPCPIQPSAMPEKDIADNGAVECGDLIVTSGEGHLRAVLLLEHNQGNVIA
jgi:hypothetical protein